MLFISLALVLGTASAQRVVRIGQPATSSDTITTTQPLQVDFGYNVPPSQLLIEAADHRRNAIIIPLIGGAVGGGLAWYGLQNPPAASSGLNPVVYLGYGIAAVSGIVGMINEGLSIYKEKQAGKGLQKITFSAGGVTYHF